MKKVKFLKNIGFGLSEFTIGEVYDVSGEGGVFSSKYWLIENDYGCISVVSELQIQYFEVIE